MIIQMEWLAIVAGTIVGILVGVTGVGGGALMTPTLIFLLSVEPPAAVAIDLVFAAITKAGGVISYFKHDVIRWPIVINLLKGILPGAILTLWSINHVTAIADIKNELIVAVLGGVLLFSSIVLFFKGKSIFFLITIKKYLNSKVRNFENENKDKLLILSGFFIGVVVTISSVGAGVLGALTLFALYPKMESVEVVATDIAHAIPVTMIAGFGHFFLGYIDFNILFFLLMGSLPGIYIGSKIGVNVSGDLIRKVMSVAFLLLGLACFF